MKTRYFWVWVLRALRLLCFREIILWTFLHERVPDSGPWLVELFLIQMYRIQLIDKFTLLIFHNGLIRAGKSEALTRDLDTIFFILLVAWDLIQLPFLAWSWYLRASLNHLMYRYDLRTRLVMSREETPTHQNLWFISIMNSLIFNT